MFVNSLLYHCTSLCFTIISVVTTMCKQQALLWPRSKSICTMSNINSPPNKLIWRMLDTIYHQPKHYYRYQLFNKIIKITYILCINTIIDKVLVKMAVIFSIKFSYDFQQTMERQKLLKNSRNYFKETFHNTKLCSILEEEGLNLEKPIKTMCQWP